MKKVAGTSPEYAKHARRFGKRVANKDARRTTRHGRTVPPDAYVWFPKKDSPKLRNVKMLAKLAA